MIVLNYTPIRSFEWDSTCVSDKVLQRVIDSIHSKIGRRTEYLSDLIGKVVGGIEENDRMPHRLAFFGTMTMDLAFSIKIEDKE